MDINSLENTTLNFSTPAEQSCVVLKPGHFISFPFYILMGLLLVKAFIKYKHNMEPTHVFDLSILIVQFLWVITNTFGLGGLQKCFSDSFAPYCLLINFINNGLRFCFYGDFIVSQLDRVAALGWSFWYHEWMTISRAVIISLICKFLMGLLTLFMMCVDVDYFKCFPKDGVPFCVNFKQNNVFWRTIPIMIVLIIIVCVTLYIGKVVYLLQKGNSPLINATNEVASPDIEQDMKEAFEIPKEEQEPVNRSCFPITQEFYEFAKKLLNVNLQTLLMSVLLIPMNVLWIYIYVTGESCEEHLPKVTGKPFYWPIAYYLVILAYLGFWIITYKKLSKF